MDVIVARCAGLDVHKNTVMACVRAPGPDGGRERGRQARGNDGVARRGADTASVPMRCDRFAGLP